MTRIGDGPAPDEIAGDRQAFIARLYPIVRKHLGFLLGFHPSTDDAVQESMLAIYRALPRFRGDSSPATWALAIASRIGRRHLRRERRLHEAPTELAPSPEGFEPLARSAEMVLLIRALERLAPKKREAFILMAIFELTAKEAAAVLGTFSNTAASRYRHARTELQDLLDQSGESLETAAIAPGALARRTAP
jgi:RNA polymerase sigma-70 factor, ECF subfamily